MCNPTMRGGGRTSSAAAKKLLADNEGLTGSCRAGLTASEAHCPEGAELMDKAAGIFMAFAPRELHCCRKKAINLDRDESEPATVFRSAQSCGACVSGYSITNLREVGR